jgi:hypothetical protein
MRVNRVHSDFSQIKNVRQASAYLCFTINVNILYYTCSTRTYYTVCKVRVHGMDACFF